MKRKLLSLFMILCMILSLNVTMAPAAFAAEPPNTTGDWIQNADSAGWTGDGSLGSPYEIGTAAQLAYLAQQVNGGQNYANKYFKLTANIDLTEHYWTPIGNITTEVFQGNFDGNNKTITGLYIGTSNNPNTDLESAGLFGCIGDGASIKDLGVGVTIYLNKETSMAGGLSGSLIGATVNNCYTTGTILGSGNWNQVAGFIGSNNGVANIINCYSTVDVSCGNADGAWAGGFIGLNGLSTTVANCYATGDVTGTGTSNNTAVGGFIGCNYQNISNCYATGNTEGGTEANVGGFIGDMNSGEVTNAYWNSNASQTVGAAARADGDKKGVGKGADETTSLTSTQMAGATNTASALVDTLNTNKGGKNPTWYSWQQAAGTNDGYPTMVALAADTVYTCDAVSSQYLDNVQTDLSEMYYMEGRSGFPSTGEEKLGYDYLMAIPATTTSAALTLNMTQKAIDEGYKIVINEFQHYILDDVFDSYSWQDVGSGYYSFDESADKSTYNLTIPSWDGQHTSIRFEICDENFNSIEYFGVNFSSADDIAAITDYSVYVKNPQAGLSMDLPASGSEEIQFYGYAVSPPCGYKRDDLTYTAERADSETMTGISMAGDTGILTVGSDAVPGLVKITATSGDGVSGYTYLIISETGKHGIASSDSMTNNPTVMLVTDSETIGTLKSGGTTQRGHNFRWLNNIDTIAESVSFIAEAPGYNQYKETFDAYKCSYETYFYMEEKTVSDDAGLTNLLSQSITVGSEAGTAVAPKTASISVDNSVSSVAATDITGATNSTVVFYGTDSSFTTAETGSVALTAGSSTTVYIKVTAQDGQTVGYYAVGITRAAAGSVDAYFLITKSSPEDSSAATDYYYVYKGTSEAELSPFTGSNVDSAANTAYSSIDKAIIDINGMSHTSAMLNFAAVGNNFATASGTLDTGAGRITLTSGIYTIRGAVRTTATTAGNGLVALNGASVIIDGATIENSADYGIKNNGSGSVMINSGTITASFSAIYSGGDGSITVNGGTIFGASSAIESSGTGNITVNSGTITSDDDAIWTSTDSSTNFTVNGGEISSKGTSEGMAIRFSGSGSLTINGGKMCSLVENAVEYRGTGSLIISGDLWDDNAKTGTLLSSGASKHSLAALCIGRSATNTKIEGGTLLSAGTAVYAKSDITISGGLIKTTSRNTSALFNESGIVTITGGTIMSSNENTSVDISEENIKFPGTIFFVDLNTTTKLYISGGTITNTAATGYAIGNGCLMPGHDSYLYLSGTPSITANTGTVYAYNNIYANDGNGTYYTGSPVTIKYSESITPGTTVGVSNVSDTTNASLFSLINEGYSLQLSGTDLIIVQAPSSSLTSILSQSITAGSEAGTAVAPKTASISVDNSVSVIAAADIAGATDSTVVFYGTDSTFTTVETGSVALTAGDNTTVYIKVTAQDGQTVSYYAVGITRAAAATSNSYFLITKSSPSDSSTETNYYYVYAGTSEAALSPFHGTNADSVSSTAYSTVDKAITDINASAASSATLYFAATGNTLENANGTLDTGSNRITLTSGIYTIKGAVRTTATTLGGGLFKLNGASVIIDGATIDSAIDAISNSGNGNIIVNSGTITATEHAIYSLSNTGDITINNGTITSYDDVILFTSECSGNIMINGGKITSNGDADGVAIKFDGSGNLNITGGRVEGPDRAVDYGGTGSLIISGDLWNDEAQTGTLLLNNSSEEYAVVLGISAGARSAEIKGGTLMGKVKTVDTESDVTISGGLITTTSNKYPALFNVNATATINGGTIISSNANTSAFIYNDLLNVPGTIAIANFDEKHAKLYINGGTITNTAETGYAIGSYCDMLGHVYLSGTPSITCNKGTIWSTTNIYGNDGNDGNSTYYTGAPVSILYSSAITPGTTVAVSDFGSAANASKFSLINEGYSLQLSGTDLIIKLGSAGSSNANLTSVLGEQVETESEGGTIEVPIRTSISVANSVASVIATDIAGATDSTVTFYGTDSTFTTTETGSVALTAGDKTTVYIKVTAEDGQTVGYYAVTISRAASSSSSSGGSSGGDSSTANSSATGTVGIVVNGKIENAGTETTSTENGKSTVTVVVSNKTIESKIKEAVKTNTTGQQNVIQVPVADIKSDVAKVELTGDIVKQLETNTFDVSVKRDAVEYVIPAKELTISNVAKELGVAEISLKDIKVEVQITKLEDSVVAKYNEVAKENGASIVFPPTAFEVVAKTINAAGKTEDVKINKFSNYVERVMEIPAGVDPSKITTGIVFNPDGTYSHVPTDVYQKDGKWYAKLNSLTNSNYSVVWNPVTVKSVENHWSKDAVNDMASRLVIFNAESFEPNKAITRADFAEYIVRALGLYREGATHENNFKDVNATGKRTLAILIANEYGIVSGYEDGTFRGNNQITREEAMTMYQRAMEITKLTGSDVNRISKYSDSTQVSKWAVPYVTDVLSAHVFNGTTKTTISPKSNLTYAEAAQAIKNLLVESNLINK